jgi:hypothetical protein
MPKKKHSAFKRMSLPGRITIVRIKRVAAHQGDPVATPQDEATWEMTLSSLERVYSHDLTLCAQTAMDRMNVIVRARECTTKFEFIGELSEMPEGAQCRDERGGSTPFKWVVVLSSQQKFFGDDLAGVINCAVDSLRRRPLPPNICMIQNIAENRGYRNHTLCFKGRSVGQIVYDAENFKVGDWVVVGEGFRGIRHLDQDEKDQLLERELRRGEMSQSKA